MASTRHDDAPRRFESDLAPPAGLYADICASIRETPAQRVDTGRRSRLALTAVLCLIPATVVIASQLVYQRQAVGLVVGPIPQSPRRAYMMAMLRWAPTSLHSES